VKHDLVRGLKDVTFEKDKLCSACQAGKQVGNTHPKRVQLAHLRHLSYCICTYLDQLLIHAVVATSMAL
jgi:type VI protein secretion system component VasF